jgi:nucleoside phosphorylase
MPQESPPLVGAIILCAKTEELAEIETVVKEYFRRAPRDSSAHSTYVLTERSEDDPGEVLLLATYHAMGNVASASATGHLAMQFKPNLMIFVGTGGSLRPKKCAIGDVIVPAGGAQTNYYDKIEDAGRISGPEEHQWPSDHRPSELRSVTMDGRVYSHRPKTDKVLPTGRSHKFVAKAMGPTLRRTSALAEGLETWEEEKSPKVHVDAMIFSWEMVLDSESYRDLLCKDLDAKAMAVDMESYGFLKAAQMLNGPEAEKPLSTIVVRGISDICGKKGNDFENGSNGIAMRNATTVACRILSNGYLAT